jgi:hypothetical protein
MKLIGLHSRRLEPNQNNPREIAFIKQWRHENKYTDILYRLMSIPCGPDDPERDIHTFGYPTKLPLGQPQKRDRIIVETVLQWLGSNVGFDFVRQALERAGYVIRRKDTDNE